MTTDPNQRMADACHLLSEHILRMPASSNRSNWLKAHIAKRVSNDRLIRDLANAYRAEYPYADAPTEYLAEALKAYDEEVN